MSVFCFSTITCFYYIRHMPYALIVIFLKFVLIYLTTYLDLLVHTRIYNHCIMFSCLCAHPEDRIFSAIKTVLCCRGFGRHSAVLERVRHLTKVILHNVQFGILSSLRK